MKETSPHQETKERLIPRKVFYRTFISEIQEVYMHPDYENVEDVRAKEGDRELLEKIISLFQRASKIHDDFYKSDISKLGKDQYKDGGFWNQYIKNIEGAISEADRNGANPFYIGPKENRHPISIDSDTCNNLQKFFELYACIKTLRPDIILTLPNGASRLYAVTKSMGFDAHNFLIIHRAVDSENRSDFGLSSEIIYQGKDIKPEMKVLVLEDTSDFGLDTTYKKAQDWLQKRGIESSNVFFEYTASIGKIEYFDDAVEEAVDTQNKIYDENNFNSLANDCGFLSYSSEFWTKTKNRITDICEEHPEIYHEFFEHIRNLE